jgi:hypothetical protein
VGARIRVRGSCVSEKAGGGSHVPYVYPLHASSRLVFSRVLVVMARSQGHISKTTKSFPSFQPLSATFGAFRLAWQGHKHLQVSMSQKDHKLLEM